MTNAKRLILAWLGSTLLSGCVAIPCGTTTFTTEYPADIRATDEKPAKEYMPFVLADEVQGRGVNIGLCGDITETQPQVLHYESVSLDKKRWISFGIWPDFADVFFHPKGALYQTRDGYDGNGQYSTDGGSGAGWMAGKFLTHASVGLLGTPFALLWGIFGPFEHDWHYLGKPLDTKYQPGREITVRDTRQIDLLLKFPPEDRKSIGAWTWHDDAQHPQNTFWHAFTKLQWVGVSKYCTYVVHDPVETDRTRPVAPRIAQSRQPARGPYGVFLQIPELGYVKALEIPRGESSVYFDLTDAANGQERVQGRVRFLPPSGGMEEAWDDDARAMLELLEGKDMPVMLALPPPRLK